MAIFLLAKYVSYNNSSSVGVSKIKLWTASSTLGCLVQHRIESSYVEKNRSVLLLSSISVALNDIKMSFLSSVIREGKSLINDISVPDSIIFDIKNYSI
jgi:hypothetical protein